MPKTLVRQLIILIAVICTANIRTYSQDCLKADIILIADMSGSVRGNEPFMADALDAFVDRFSLAGDVRFGMIVFGDGINNHLPLTTDRKALKEQTKRVRNSQAWSKQTNLYIALNLARKDFMEHSYGSKRIIILISDGHVNNASFSFDRAWELRQQLQVIICGILINNSMAKSDYMKSISDIYVSTSFESLAQKLKNLEYCL